MFFFFFHLFSDVMVLNDIIEQAAGRQSRGSDQGGKYIIHFLFLNYFFHSFYP